jgi:hypothetical protein
MAVVLAMSEDWNDDKERREGIPISPVVTLGNIWSMIVTIVGAIVSMLIFAWWLSGYLQGFRDSIDRVTETISVVRNEQQTSRDLVASIDRRLVPLELDFANNGPRRTASNEHFSKIDAAIVDLKHSSDDLERADQDTNRTFSQRLDEMNGKIQALYAKYYAVYKDLAGFKCKIKPSECKPSVEDNTN